MKGFTIIEVLVALFVLAVGIAAVLNMFPLGLQVAISSQTASVAVQLGQAKMEEMVSKEYNDLSFYLGTNTEEYGSIAGFDRYKRITKVSCAHRNDLSEADCAYDSINDPGPLKKIEITVFWKSSLIAAEQSINVASLISRR